MSPNKNFSNDYKNNLPPIPEDDYLFPDQGKDGKDSAANVKSINLGAEVTSEGASEGTTSAAPKPTHEEARERETVVVPAIATSIANEGADKKPSEQESKSLDETDPFITMLGNYQPSMKDWENGKLISNQGSLNTNIPNFIITGLENYITLEFVKNQKKIEKKDFVAEALDEYLKKKLKKFTNNPNG